MDEELQKLQARLYRDISHVLANNEGGRVEMTLSYDEWQAVLSALEIAAGL